MSQIENTNSGISITGLLFIIFLILKLTGNIDWSWWWVTSPLWIPLALLGSIFIIGTIVVVLLMIFGFSKDDIENGFKRFRE